MSDNKQPDALDRLRRRPAPSATPTPVAKDAPLLNDEARKLLEDKSKAAALATKRAAEAGAKKSLEAGKAALGKFNSWRHERAEAKVKVEAPVEALAPLEGITPADVAEALTEREAALPVAEAPPMAVAPVGEDITDTMAKDHVLGAADVDPSGLLRMDGMGSLALAAMHADKLDLIDIRKGTGFLTGEKYPFAPDPDIESLAPTLESEEPMVFGVTSTGMTSNTQKDIAQQFDASAADDTEAQTDNNVACDMRVSLLDRKRLKDLLPTNAFWIMIVGGLLSAAFVALIAFYLANREYSSPVSTQAPVAPQAAPVVVEPVTIPAEAPIEEPTEPVAMEPEVVEAPAKVAPPVAKVVPVAAPVIPAPVAEPEVQVIKPAKPIAVEKPVVRPAPKPVAAAKPPAVEKPKAPKLTPAPAVSPESKKQIDSIRDFEKQLENMGG